MAGLNFVERVINTISPGWASSRFRARMQLEFAVRNLGGYESASGGRKGLRSRLLNHGPSASSAAANPSNRNVARDLIRNSPYAVNGVRKFGAHVVGGGIVPRFEGGSEAARKRAKDAWEKWNEDCEPEGRNDFYGLQSLACQSTFSDGNVLRVWSYDRNTGPKCELREIDFLDLSRNELARNGSGERIVNGVRFDAKGRRKGYFLFDQHPAETGGFGGYGQSREWDARFVDHVFDQTRPGQMLGVSAFAPVARSLSQYHDLEGAMLDRRQLETFIALVVKQSAESMGPVSGHTVKGGASEPLEEIRSGAITYLRDGEELQNVTVTSPGDSDVFGKMILHGVAAGLGIPYHVLTGDVSEANYTSQRAANLNFHVTLDHWQKHVMQRQFCRTAWQRLVAWEMAIGARRGNLDEVRVIWTPPARAVVDPKKDIEALIAAVEAGFKSEQDAIQGLGRDPIEVLEDRRAWAELIDKFGLEAIREKTAKKSKTDAVELEGAA